jgi:hypothetical protein
MSQPYNIIINSDRVFQIELLISDLLDLPGLDPALRIRAIEIQNYFLNAENE